MTNARTKAQRFRLTVTLPSPAPAPAVEWRPFTLDGNALVFAPSDATIASIFRETAEKHDGIESKVAVLAVRERLQDLAQVEIRRLAEEVVTRELLVLDVTDASAVASFVEAHGFIHPDRHPELLAKAHELLGVDPGPPSNEPYSVSVQEVAALLQITQAAGRHWLSSRSGVSVTDAWPADMLLEPTTVDYWQTLADVVEAGLSSYSPRVRLLDSPYVQDRDHDLVDGLFLQLALMVIEDTPFKTCANENCGLLFYRQRGRAEHGQFRTEGVKYCSRSCANAQSQRELRRRRRSGDQEG